MQILQVVWIDNISHGFATNNLRQMRLERPQVSVVPPGALVKFYFHLKFAQDKNGVVKFLFYFILYQLCQGRCVPHTVAVSKYIMTCINPTELAVLIGHNSHIRPNRLSGWDWCWSRCCRITKVGLCSNLGRCFVHSNSGTKFWGPSQKWWICASWMYQK